jgi:D-sedoheptulose 7-phosphate isomerase
MDSSRLLNEIIADHVRLIDRMARIDGIERSAEQLVETLRQGRKILVCGNGGSAADAQHFAAELIGGFERRRDPLPALALAADPSVLTALGNDDGFERVFAKQVRGLGGPGDALVAISTSGHSGNVVAAVEAARARHMTSIGLLGHDGGRVGALVDIAVVVPHAVTARIQEVHLVILHFWAAVIERRLFPGGCDGR